MKKSAIIAAQANKAKTRLTISFCTFGPPYPQPYDNATSAIEHASAFSCSFSPHAHHPCSSRLLQHLNYNRGFISIAPRSQVPTSPSTTATPPTFFRFLGWNRSILPTDDRILANFPPFVTSPEPKQGKLPQRQSCRSRPNANERVKIALELRTAPDFPTGNSWPTSFSRKM